MYDLIANNYSSIFPLDNETVDFIVSHLQQTNGNKILDIGCATGDLALALSQKGHSVLGIDLNSTMVEIAQGKVNNNLLSFNCQDMRTIDRNIQYDCIVCLGNTLPHMPTWEELNQFINLLHSILHDDGVLIIQILNFDKILKDGNVNFKVIEGDDFVFNRKYTSISNDSITFEIVVLDKNTLEKHNDSTLLLPIKRKELLASLQINGFQDAKVFSGFNKKDASDNDFFNVFVGRKAK